MVVSDEIHRLKLEELREELSNRGLDFSGTKSEMIDRLYAALDNEKPQSSSTEVNDKSVVDYNVDDNHSPTHDSHKTEYHTSQQDSSTTIYQKSVLYNTPTIYQTKFNDHGIEPPDWELRQDVILDYFNCDINFVIDDNGLSAHPFTMEGFSLMWAGGRANFGINRNRVFYEVYNIKYLDVETNEEEVRDCDHGIRVGWSSGSSSFSLGEDKFSYGYGSKAKKSLANNFEDYGRTFDEGDVITCYLDYGQFDAIISYAVNGEDQGEAFVINNPDGRPLFPHIYVKNVSFSVNFDGELNQKNCKDNPDDWFLIGKLPIEDRVRGMCPPLSKKDCEVIMMIGLPSSGKTTYAEKISQERPNKMYNLLGTNYILDKMKVIGLRRKRNYRGRWEVLISKATKCLNTIIFAAASRRRNYILDQTNVYPTAQRRKMKPFEGFEKRAIVVIPDDEEYQRRIEKVRLEDGKDISDSAVDEMKKNFVIPKTLLEDSNSPFVEVEFPELSYEKAQELISKYNEEATKVLAENSINEKRSRNDCVEQYSDHYNNNNNGHYGKRGNFRGNRQFRGNQRFQRPFMPRPMMRPYGMEGPPRGPFMPYMARGPIGGPHMSGWHRPPYRPRMPPIYMPNCNDDFTEQQQQEDEQVDSLQNVVDPVRPPRMTMDMPRPENNKRPPFGHPRGVGVNPRNSYQSFPQQQQQMREQGIPQNRPVPSIPNPYLSVSCNPYPNKPGDFGLDSSSVNKNGANLSPYSNNNTAIHPQQQQIHQHQPPPPPPSHPLQHQAQQSMDEITHPNANKSHAVPGNDGVPDSSSVPSYAGGFSNPMPGYGIPSSTVNSSYPNSYRKYSAPTSDKFTPSGYSNFNNNNYSNNHKHLNYPQSQTNMMMNQALMSPGSMLVGNNGSCSTNINTNGGGSVVYPPSGLTDPTTATGLLAPSAAATDPSALAVAAYANYYASVGVSGAAAGKAAAGTSSSETSLQAAIAAAASFNQKQVIKSTTIGPVPVQPTIGVQHPMLQNTVAPAPVYPYSQQGHTVPTVPYGTMPVYSGGTYPDNLSAYSAPGSIPSTLVPGGVGGVAPKTGVTTSGQPVNYLTRP